MMRKDIIMALSVLIILPVVSSLDVGNGNIQGSVILKIPEKVTATSSTSSNSTYNATYATWAYNQTTPAESFCLAQGYQKISTLNNSGFLTKYDYGLSTNGSGFITNNSNAYLNSLGIGGDGITGGGALGNPPFFVMVNLAPYFERNTDNAMSGNFYFVKNRGGNSVRTGDAIGRFWFGGYNGTANIARAWFGSTVDGAVINATATVPLSLAFATSDQSHSGNVGLSIERMRIGSNGSISMSENLYIRGNLSVKRPFGMFSSTQTQTMAVANTAYPITFNWTEDAFEIYKESDNSNFTFGQNGEYLIELSPIFKTNTNNKHVNIWVQKNGRSISRSNTKLEIPNAGTEQMMPVYFIIGMNMTDKFRVMMLSDDGGSQLIYTTNTSIVPETPSIIMTITKISDKSNTRTTFLTGEPDE